MEILKLALIYTMCHLVGDYVLQNDFIAKTKGSNPYHMFVHCMLYCVPFMFFLPSWQIMIIYVVHVFTDSAKAIFNKITYIQDQTIHYLTLFVVLLINTMK